MNTTTEEDATIVEAAMLILAAIRTSHGNEIAILADALRMCGTAAAEQGVTAIRADRERCAGLAEAAAVVIREAEFVGPREAAEALREVRDAIRSGATGCPLIG